ncbi:MAG: putative rane protein, partial [Oscillospiraceae bacterium]|nr:putative rane protein [Oscillospiraceae bacterium]
MGDQKQGKSKNILLLAGAFFVPALVLLIVYARFGMFPFGEKSVLIMDMSDQYVNFFAGLRDIVLGKDSLLYSWKMGFGGNFIGVFAYYISSPFSVITFFFPKSMLPTALMVLNIVKIGLCGLSFSIFLKFLFKKNNWSVVVFSTLYALMAYNIAYSMSLMWLDGVIWLPILMIGIEKLIRSGQKALFITVLSIMFISNYYISYMVGIFCLIYFVYRFCVIRFEKQEKPNFPRRLVDFLISAVAAAGISSWLIVPTFFSLLKGKIGGYNYAPDRILNFDFYKIFSKMFVGNYDTITNDGLPNIYCGIIVVILFIAFFFVKSVSGKEKILTLSVLALFLISFYVNYIDMAWHIFQYPNWFPYRYSFLFSFFAIMIAYKAFLKLKEIHVLAFVGATSVILIALYMFSKQVYQPKPHIQNTLVIILCILYLICLVVTKFNKKLYKFVLPLMIGLVMFETYSSSYDIVKGLDRNFIYKTNESYVSFKEDIDPVVQKAKQAEDGFYRIEKNFERSKNDAIAFGYNGITNYSSAYDRNTNMFLKSLGFAQTYLWSSYFGSTVLTDSLFDVKYVMSKTPLSSHYEKTMDHDGVTLYKNPSAMPLAFMVDKGLLAVDTPSENYLFNQNRLLQGMTGSYDRYFNQ